MIGTGKITETKELRESLKNKLPTDAQFEQAFSTARVSKAYLARYYLRALDKTITDNPTPEFVANEDYEAANLEHIIPVKPSAAWKISEEDASNAQQMIGNLRLLSTKKNVIIGNDSFAEELKVYKDSGYSITNQLEKYGTEFGIEQVKERQAELAMLAPKTWSFKFD